MLRSPLAPVALFSLTTSTYTQIAPRSLDTVLAESYTKSNRSHTLSVTGPHRPPTSPAARSTSSARPAREYLSVGPQLGHCRYLLWIDGLIVCDKHLNQHLRIDSHLSRRLKSPIDTHAVQ